MLSAVFSAEWEVGRGLTAEQSIVLMSIGTVSHRSRGWWAARWVSRSASQSALMTEANAKFKRLLT